MNCEKCKELLVAYVEDLLEESQKQAIESHLNTCPPCRAEANELFALRDRLTANGKALAQTDLEDKILNRILQEQSSKLREVRKSNKQIRLWRIIMKSRITKLTTAAAIIVAALVVMQYFRVPVDVASVAWGKVLDNICNSKTLTYLVRTKEQEPPVMKVMTIDPHLCRFEWLSKQIPRISALGGDVWILDSKQGKTLILDTAKKTARIHPAKKTMSDMYDAFRNFRDRVDFSVEEIGHRQVGNKEAIGFKLRKEDENREMAVWADPETKLPILIEETLVDREGQARQFVITDIVFDDELDMSLFSLKPPDDYEVLEFRYDEKVNRLKSGVNMDRILKACRNYVNEHNGQWPDSLQELDKYGLEKEVFTNPRQPEREVGYVYLKPPASPSESRIVLHEAYDVWGQGINVGFANTRIQFIQEESEFKKRLKESLEDK